MPIGRARSLLPVAAIIALPAAGRTFANTFGAQMQPSDTLKTLYLVSALPE